MDFFSKLTKVATATLSDAMRSVNEVMSQEQFGDPTGKRAIYEGLDVTYLSRHCSSHIKESRRG